MYIMTKDEYQEMMDSIPTPIFPEDLEIERKIAVDDAVFWLKNELYNTGLYSPDRHKVESKHYNTVEEFIEALKKAMEK